MTTVRLVPRGGCLRMIPARRVRVAVVAASSWALTMSSPASLSHFAQTPRRHDPKIIRATLFASTSTRVLFASRDAPLSLNELNVAKGSHRKMRSVSYLQQV